MHLTTKTHCTNFGKKNRVKLLENYKGLSDKGLTVDDRTFFTK
jgi:hypothetical protein